MKFLLFNFVEIKTTPAGLNQINFTYTWIVYGVDSTLLELQLYCYNVVKPTVSFHTVELTKQLNVFFDEKADFNANETLSDRSQSFHLTCDF